ncbi:hypothetical protein [Belnapia rosea]|uniref:Uncharacterized protein n=1 Tax=Belnapia rosea TaxID=938405 RepID=A0A1G6PML6_9PROT|nr:hypothetical protein [Belnapia rosea]SDC81211.1 hypothetical protein SAMN04487779_1002442 [Belnapia rosea]
MSDARLTIFADGILDASVTYGVARLTLAQTGAEGRPLPCGQLVVPLVQLPSFVNSLAGLLKQLEAKLKEQQPQPQAEAPEAAPPSVPGAFRFG